MQRNTGNRTFCVPARTIIYFACCVLEYFSLYFVELATLTAEWQSVFLRLALLCGLSSITEKLLERFGTRGGQLGGVGDGGMPLSGGKACNREVERERAVGAASALRAAVEAAGAARSKLRHGVKSRVAPHTQSANESGGRLRIEAGKACLPCRFVSLPRRVLTCVHPPRT